MTFNDVFYPGLLICGLVVAMLLVSLVSSYIWLRHVDSRYRKCPNCHKSGVGTVVETQLLTSSSHIDHKGRRPARVTVETHEDQYQCEACDHRWTVNFQEKKRQELADENR